MNLNAQILPWMQSFSPLKPYLDRADGYFFDLDGTLVDNEGDALDLIRGVINRHIAHIDPANPGITSCYRHLAGHKLQEIVAIAEKETGIKFDEATHMAIEQEIIKQRRENLKSVNSVNPIVPLIALAQFIKNEGKPICIVTASESWRANHYVRVGGIEDIFEGQIFASNLKAKTEAHHEARETLSAVHGFNIDPRLWVGFEDSPNAVEQGIMAGATVVPHTLCTHISEQHQPARIRALQIAQSRAAESHNVPHHPVVRPIHASNAPIIRTGMDILPVMREVLGRLPDRTPGLRSVPAPRLNFGG
jgi:beta-phosphoglucomutase-like phosphatase (HAD superfamily)